ncbi:BON domain-containing protein [Ramlibacter tataouinensis]|uniref:BON domain-containing protein n=1 Tax=Ramlibacter tataouinensis (strain ATCC BAA-407 / DSM 14655 / LMG 21543 / TTB310) TaxID=365046 RepID=F5XWQ5_RAMTT|nr:BON domain-containing protein [Ramlibacter tataouinensis]AEG94199.1 Conserved hypothetical protein [Ramlibacter tataouinensis TTB310]
MKHANALLLAVMLGVAAVSTGCAVARDQSTVGGYVDDKVITTKVKAKLLEDKSTGGMSINVDTLNGTVALSGFAKSEAEKAAAGRIARTTDGVKDVRNNLIVRP